MVVAAVKRMLLSPWKALPMAVQSRLSGLRRSMRRKRQSSGITITEAEKFRAGLPTLSGLLENIKNNGFSPFAIIDIGANAGEWSRIAASIFSSAQILMFDG